VTINEIHNQAHINYRIPYFTDKYTPGGDGRVAAVKVHLYLTVYTAFITALISPPQQIAAIETIAAITTNM